MSKHGVMVARANPLQLGHEAVDEIMLESFGTKNSLQLLGSSNSPFSLKHFFNYSERRAFYKKVFPDLKVVGIPDYSTNQEWLGALDDLLIAANFDPKETVFYGGCEEDVTFFLEAKRTCIIINRFDGHTPKISATEVRDALIYNRSLNGLVNPLIMDDVRNVFATKWEKFKQI